MTAIRVALIDDQMLIRQGIKGLLELSDQVEVVALASDGDQAVTLAKKHCPDVILMDIRMPRMNGIQAIEALNKVGIEVPVIILTTFDDHELVLKGIQAGAKGYMLKDVSLESLIGAIESVFKGEMIVQPAITENLLRGLHGQNAEFESLPNPQDLTNRETEILRLMASGYSNKEISSALHKSEGTIKNHVSNILSKLGVRDRTRAVLRSIELGLI